MALPYKLFKTLTIDGVTMGVNTDIGTVLEQRTDFTCPNTYTWYKHGEVIIPEPGLYLINVWTYFGNATNTGAIWHETGWGNGTTGSVNQTVKQVDATNVNVTLSLSAAQIISEDYKLAAFSRVTTPITANCSCILQAVRLLNYPTT